MEGEASSSKKRIRFPSLSPDDEETDNNTQLGVLLDMDLITCPVCCQGFTSPIFQCENGHVACSSCCNKLRNKCAYCTSSIGTFRCRAMEKMVESIVVQCPNFKHGCKQILSNNDHKTHEEKCSFLQCFCPLAKCDFKGAYKDIFQHFDAAHKHEGWTTYSCLYNNPITFGKPYVVSMHISEKMSVLMEITDSLLFIVQCFENPYGVCVSVNCIAPFCDEVGEFSYSVSFTNCGEVKLKSELSKMKKVKEVSFETPEADFMLFPSYLMRIDGRLKLTVVINKL